MSYLIAVSLIWAFSFGLTKHFLQGVDSALVAAIRMGLALLVFLPLLRPARLAARDTVRLVLIGSVQYGVMYLAFFAAFQKLAAYQVVVLTVTTPILVWLVDGLCERRVRWDAFLAAMLAVVGALVIIASKPLGAAQWEGVVLVQISNLCFAIGQVFYRRWRVRSKARVAERYEFGWLYLGGAAVTVSSVGFGSIEISEALFALSAQQWLVLFYLGVLASGLGFFLWNLGAARVSVGVLAAMNNAKLPLGVLASLLVFGEQAVLWRLAVGGLFIFGAVFWMSRRMKASD